METYRAASGLSKKFEQGKYRKNTQRYLVVRELLKLKSASLDTLVGKLDNPVYWSTVKHKDRNGIPKVDSWFVQEGGGVRSSVHYHLRELEKGGLIENLNRTNK